MWYYNAAYETECILNVQYAGSIPLKGLAECYEAVGNVEMAEKYRDELETL